MKKQQGFSIIEMLAVLLILMVVGGTAWLTYKKMHSKATPIHTASTASVSTATTPPPKPMNDSWTGKGTTTNWSDAANWSNGVPGVNYTLIFPTNSTSFITSKNDLQNLNLYSLDFPDIPSSPNNTMPAGYGILITGNPIRLSGGIVAEPTESADIALNITLTADQTFNVYGNQFTLGASSGSTNTINLNGHTLDFAGMNKGYITVYSTLAGSGKLLDDVAYIDLAAASKAYTGSFEIANGSQLTIDTTVPTTSGSLGTGAITVDAGGAFNVYVLPNASRTISNPVVLHGSGLAESSINVPGAIVGIGTTGTLLFTGAVTLQSDTTLGAKWAADGGYKMPVITYHFARSIITNGYHLTAISGSGASIAAL
jgi:hypothetical protein